MKFKDKTMRESYARDAFDDCMARLKEDVARTRREVLTWQRNTPGNEAWSILVDGRSRMLLSLLEHIINSNDMSAYLLDVSITGP